MKLAGIIAEYNPFHNGHLYHLEETRRMGATHIAAVMSGSFVQRGDIAVCSKWARAAAAIQGGVDLVVELPAVHALSSAQNFARAGVSLLHQLGADCLSFGSESGDAGILLTAAGCCDEAEQSPLMEEFLSKGLSYPRARAAAVAVLRGEEWAQRITHANNLLGIEYIRAARALSPELSFLVVPRVQAGHDCHPIPPVSGSSAQEHSISADSILCASAVRRLLRKGEFAAAKRYLPDAAYRYYMDECAHLRAPVTERAVERILLGRLRELSPEEFAALPDVSEGLENRLFRAARAAVSLEDFYMKVKTKRYTMARIRRISFCALLGITREDQNQPPAYVRVLAVNRRGMEILARAKTRAEVPIGSKFANLYRLCPPGIETEVRATDLYSLVMPAIHKSGMDFTHQPLIFD